MEALVSVSSIFSYSGNIWDGLFMWENRYRSFKNKKDGPYKWEKSYEPKRRTVHVGDVPPYCILGWTVHVGK